MVTTWNQIFQLLKIAKELQTLSNMPKAGNIADETAVEIVTYIQKRVKELTKE